MGTLIQYAKANAATTIYRHLLDSAGQRWNAPSDQFQSYSSGQWANYSEAMSEQGASQVFQCNFPGSIATPGDYLLVIYNQAGGSPAEGDPILDSFWVHWTGSDLVDLISRASEVGQSVLLAAMTDVLEILPDDTAGFAEVLLDLADGVETSFTMRQAMRLILSALAGRLNGAGGTTVNIRDVNNTKNRIEATVDSSGNRTATTYDVSD